MYIYLDASGEVLVKTRSLKFRVGQKTALNIFCVGKGTDKRDYMQKINHKHKITPIQ